MQISKQALPRRNSKLHRCWPQVLLILLAMGSTAAQAKETGPAGSGITDGIDTVGDAGVVTARVRASGAISLVASICQSDPATAACLAPPAPQTDPQPIVADPTPTYSVFVSSPLPVALAPDRTRIQVEFVDEDQVVRGSTSVAVRTHF